MLYILSHIFFLNQFLRPTIKYHSMLYNQELNNNGFMRPNLEFIKRQTLNAQLQINKKNTDESYMEKLWSDNWGNTLMYMYVSSTLFV